MTRPEALDSLNFLAVSSLVWDQTAGIAVSTELWSAQGKRHEPCSM